MDLIYDTNGKIVWTCLTGCQVGVRCCGKGCWYWWRQVKKRGLGDEKDIGDNIL